MHDEDSVVFSEGRVTVVRSRPSGEFQHIEPRCYIRHPGAVAILPVLSDDPLSLVLIENYRHTTGGRMLEIPAGTLDRSETLEAAAGRELYEESGYTAGKLQRLITFMPSPGMLDERMHLFLATELVPGEQCLDDNEDAIPVVLTWAEAWRRLSQQAQHEAADGKTMLALLYYRQVVAAGAATA